MLVFSKEKDSACRLEVLVLIAPVYKEFILVNLYRLVWNDFQMIAYPLVLSLANGNEFSEHLLIPPYTQMRIKNDHTK